MSDAEKRAGNAGNGRKNAAGWKHLTHEFGPLYDVRSKILILGSFPSIKSREQQFYYGHPRNRFWKIMAAVCAEADLIRRGRETGTVRGNKDHCLDTAVFAQEAAVSVCVSEKLRTGELAVPETVAARKELLLSHGIALWDVIESCDIRGSSDASIRNARVNDLSVILDRAQIGKICVNGGTAYRLYEKYMARQPSVQGIEAVRLPSTSPANAAWSQERLLSEWGKIAAELAMFPDCDG